MVAPAGSATAITTTTARRGAIRSRDGFISFLVEKFALSSEDLSVSGWPKESPCRWLFYTTRGAAATAFQRELHRSSR
jgi:hypothetical protein